MNKGRSPILVVALLLAACSESKHNDIPALNAGMVDTQYLRHRDLEGMQANISMWAVCTALEQTYKVPISFEWPFVTEDRTTVEEPLIEFEFAPEASLSATLDSLVSKSEDWLRWDNIRGNIVIYP